MSKILVIAPHPDDEVLGCGGAMAKHTKRGDKVYLCFVTKAYAPEWPEEFLTNRPKEIEKSNKILGVKKTYFLNYPAAKLDTILQKELNEAIARVVNRVKPDVLYIPHKGDLHSDHRLVFEASLVATRPQGHVIKKILSYEILSETEWGQLINLFVPGVYVDISKTFKKKIKAIKAYKSELRSRHHPRSLDVIEALAKKRGSEIGVKFAEAFELIREVVD